jgi:hypothetical protein
MQTSGSESSTDEDIDTEYEDVLSLKFEALQKKLLTKR